MQTVSTLPAGSAAEKYLRIKAMLDDKEYLTSPDNEAEKVFCCFACGKSIYEWDLYYEVNGLELMKFTGCRLRSMITRVVR